MVSALKSEEAVSIKFGGGLHTRASEEDINEREAHSGQNFDLDFVNQQLRPRKAFDLVDTAPNGGSIDGFVTLKDSSGNVTFLAQAGTNVYSYDGATFTLVGTVNAGAKIRGRKEANSQSLDKVIITDLALQEPILEWDGTTLSNTSFTGTGLSGSVFAKFGRFVNERLVLANLITNGTATPHVIVGADRDNYTILTPSDGTGSRPTSGATASDPWYLPVPDLRAINGIVQALGIAAFSTEDGNLFKLTGSDATDFAVDSFYPGSGASGDEALEYVGNDIVYGRVGRMESLAATDQFGDVRSDDVSAWIQDSIDGYDDWTIVYNSRLNRTYFLADGTNELWVFHPDMITQNLSPWSKWVTAHASNFAPTAMMSCWDPSDGMEYVFFGDASGNIYRLEGTAAGDAASANIKTVFRSRIFSAPLDQKITDVSGLIRYRKNEAFTATIRILWAGESVFDESVSISTTVAAGSYFGGDYYFSGESYFGAAFAGRITSQQFGIPGQSNNFQVEIEVDDTATFEINEVLIRFHTSS